MLETFFTQIEANQKVGQKVRCISSIASIPKGTQGIIVKAVRRKPSQWTVRVQWNVPRATSFIDATEVSFFKREKLSVDDLSKTLYHDSLEEIN